MIGFENGAPQLDACIHVYDPYVLTSLIHLVLAPYKDTD